MTSRNSGIARSFIAGGLATTLGIGVYVYDDWCEGLQIPLLKAAFNILEILVMAPGMGILAFVLFEQHRFKEQRHLDRLAQENERRFRFLGRIAASMAHEVRNPLHNIHLLNDELRSQVQESAKILVDRIQNNIQRLDQSTRLIYELARPQKKWEGDGFGGAELLPLLQAVIDEMQKKYPTPIRLVVEEPLSLGLVFGRAEGIRIILLNLIRNAVEAAGKNEVIISCSIVQDTIHVTIENPGVLPEEVFFLDAEIVSKKPGGLGVGISIARHLTEVFGGNINFYNRSGIVVTELLLKVEA